ncbi:hypothetical protein [Chitinophaga filiformis]|uniref:Glycine zipper n=1 Tax=Chitinophaga filiformis TaxID=104663 RepID=A0A1G7Y7N6_CHIFI|nr:hypothetical protein [Chitinophaga filiformis]SDG92316.1 hypothetical protein SAMN04488121_107232 [Chitinophaga filiformis]
MKKIYYLLLPLLFCSISPLEAQKRFIRLYDEQGQMIAKGDFTATTDTSIIIQSHKTQLEIPVRQIGTIKTKRTFGHAIAIGATIGVVSGALLGLATGQANEDVYGGFGYETSPGNDVAAGALVGVVVGAAVGTIISVTQNRSTITINGNTADWQMKRKILDQWH